MHSAVEVAQQRLVKGIKSRVGLILVVGDDQTDADALVRQVIEQCKASLRVVYLNDYFSDIETFLNVILVGSHYDPEFASILLRLKRCGAIPILQIGDTEAHDREALARLFALSMSFKANEQLLLTIVCGPDDLDRHIAEDLGLDRDKFYRVDTAERRRPQPEPEPQQIAVPEPHVIALSSQDKAGPREWRPQIRPISVSTDHTVDDFNIFSRRMSAVSIVAGAIVFLIVAGAVGAVFFEKQLSALFTPAAVERSMVPVVSEVVPTTGTAGMVATTQTAPLIEVPQQLPVDQEATSVLAGPATTVAASSSVQRDVKQEHTIEGIEETRIEATTLQALESPQPAEVYSRIDQLLERANRQLSRLRLTIPADDNAFASYQEILRLDPANKRARDGIELIKRRYDELADGALIRGELKLALVYYERALRVDPEDKQFATKMRELEATLNPE